MVTDKVQKVQELYDASRFEDALELISAEGQGQMTTTQDWAELMRIKAWCHWRRKEYEEARKIAKEYGIYEILAYLAAYVDKEFEALLALRPHLENNINFWNAVVIIARTNDLPDQEALVREALGLLLRAGFPWKVGEVAEANLAHNLGRYYAEGSDDEAALRWYVSARDAYEILGGNWHHRAALHFWMSKSHEALGNLAEALFAQRASVALWHIQCDLDPKNESFQKNLAGGKERLAELDEKWRASISATEVA